MLPNLVVGSLASDTTGPIESLDIDDYSLLSGTHFSLGFQPNMLFYVFFFPNDYFLYSFWIYFLFDILILECPKDVPCPLNSPFIYLYSLP